jgi:adenosylhomocysteine nucleosidase
MRVALLAPMQQELRPLVRKLRLERSDDDGAHHVGRRGEVELIASLTGIGTRAASRATASILDAFSIDHVMVVGIAGGVDPEQPIGASITPELVVDDATGQVFRPTALSASPPRGRLVTSDHLVTDRDEAERLRRQDVVGLDMETAAIASVCEQRSCAWSVFRAISDRVSDGITDPAVLALAGPDGSGITGAVLRYLVAKPWRLVRLAPRARGTLRASEAAAGAAILGLDVLSP